MKRDLKTMDGIFSKKSLLFFHMSIYRKYTKLAIVVCLIVSLSYASGFLFSLAVYLKRGGGSEYDKMKNISNAVFICLWGLGYIGFILAKTQKISITFKNVNHNAGFLRDYRLVNNKELNQKLNVVVTGFLARLDQLTSRKKQQKNMSVICKFFMFYLNLVRLKAKNDDSEVVDERFMFRSQNACVNLYEMLQMVNEYFNSFDLKIKVLFSPKSINL